MYEKKSFIFTGIVIILAAIVLWGTHVYYSNKLDKLGRTNDQLAERLLDATDTNRRLTETVEQCRYLVTGLKDATDRSVRTVNEAVNIIEETREAVGALEAELGLWDTDSYYDWFDNWLSSELEKNSVEPK